MGLGAKRTRTASFNFLPAPQKADGLGRYPLFPARKTEALRGRATHDHALRLDGQGFGQVSTHGFAVVSYLRALADDNGVYIRHLPGLAYEHPHLAQKPYRIGVFITFVGVGEVVTDVFEAGGAQHGVGDGVSEDIGVGVTDQAPLEGYIDPAEDELALRAVFRKGVDVYAQAYPESDLGVVNL